ncbi:Nup133 N terminal like [Carpediemonas membranifera]|uniref:Nup133 N terminal like n=1 Tax=Carpediemonas membranifera TaxID=201153 RepID=A0A8J6B3W1_9EUKA|nr:Nup133 N terminal like [Carpediemonas membranifera]|eukprot:KAG9392387.1 Nup133 N terminal like [Carpediemonas membranifera]
MSYNALNSYEDDEALFSVTSIPVPMNLTTHLARVRNRSFVGILPEIGHAWFTVDNQLHLFSFGNQSGDTFSKDDFESIVVSCALLNPYPDIFQDKYVLVVATADKVHFIGVSHVSARSPDSPLTLRPYPSFECSHGGQTVLKIFTHDHRVFLACLSGDLLEVTYTPRNFLMFSNPRPKVSTYNSSILSTILPYALRRDRDPLVDVAADNEGLLYTLTEHGTISIWRLTDDGAVYVTSHKTSLSELSHVVGLGQPGDKGRLRVGLRFVSLATLADDESRHIRLVATTNKGIRVMFSKVSGLFEKARLAIQTARPAPPMPDHTAAEHTFSLYSRGVYFTAVHAPTLPRGKNVLAISASVGPTGSAGEGKEAFRLIPTGPESGRGGADDAVLALCEIPPSARLAGQPGVAVPLTARNDVGPDYVPAAETETQHVMPRRRFVAITHRAVIIIDKDRPVDTLRKALDPAMVRARDAFVALWGPVETAAMALQLAVPMDIGSPGIGRVPDTTAREALRLFIKHALSAPQSTAGRAGTALSTAHQVIALNSRRALVGVRSRVAFEDRGGHIVPVWTSAQLRPLAASLTGLCSVITGRLLPEVSVSSAVEGPALKEEAVRISQQADLLRLLLRLADLDLEAPSRAIPLSRGHRQALLQLSFVDLCGTETGRAALRALLSSLAVARSMGDLLELLASECPSIVDRQQLQLLRATSLLDQARRALPADGLVQQAVGILLTHPEAADPLDHIVELLLACNAPDSAARLALERLAAEPGAEAALALAPATSSTDPAHTRPNESIGVLITLVQTMCDALRAHDPSPRHRAMLAIFLDPKYGASWAQCLFRTFIQEGSPILPHCAPSPFLETFLQATDIAMLWRYYGFVGRNSDAARVLLVLAESGDSIDGLALPQRSLDDRLEMLGTAVQFADQSTAPDGPDLAKDARGRLAVGTLQRELLMRITVRAECVEHADRLRASLVSIDELYNSVAVPLRIYDVALKLLKLGGYNGDEAVPESLWLQLIRQHVVAPAESSSDGLMAPSAQAGLEQVADIILALESDPLLLPIAFVLSKLECYAAFKGAPTLAVINGFLAAPNAPLTALVQGYDALAASDRFILAIDDDTDVEIDSDTMVSRLAQATTVLLKHIGECAGSTDRSVRNALSHARTADVAGHVISRLHSVRCEDGMTVETLRGLQSSVFSTPGRW